MKLFIGGRQMGKTTKLIKYAKEHNCVIVEPTCSMAKYTKSLDDTNSIQVICAKDLLNDRIMNDINQYKDGIVFDDVTMCIKFLMEEIIKVPVEASTVEVNVPFFSLDTDDSDDNFMEQVCGISKNASI